MRHGGILSLTVTCLLLTACGSNGPRDNETSETGQTSTVARHVILFIPDGSQLAHEIVASRYSTGRDDGLAMQSWPYRAFATTWDVGTYQARADAAGAAGWDAAGFDPRIGYDPAVTGSAPYPIHQAPPAAELDLIARATDSAAAGTALATGHKVDAGNIAWRAGDPADGALATIGALARAQKGMAMGVVSTVPFSHATPAVFVSHNTTRGDYAGIATEIVTRMRPRVVIGAGHPDPQGDGHANHQYCPAPVYASLVDGSAGYRFVESDGEQGADARLLDAADQAAASDASLFGLFGSAATATDPGSHFAPPVPVHAPGAPAFERDGRDPSLATCTEAAMRVLARDPEGFVLMVEGGDIDWANHGDRSTWMIGAWQQMDEAIHRAQALVESRSCGGMTPENTLLIVVSDHGNGLLRLREPYDLPAGSLPSAGQYAIGEDLFHAMDGSGAIVADPDLRYPNAPGFDPRDPSTWFGGHTNELVTCHAWGAGIGHLQAYQDDWYGAQTPLLDHTHVFQAMADFLGLDPGHDGPQPVLTGGD